ncbi:hypothetical protein TrLO_g1584, partial [Triparma laevis f. longispina]
MSSRLRGSRGTLAPSSKSLLDTKAKSVEDVGYKTSPGAAPGKVKTSKRTFTLSGSHFQNGELMPPTIEYSLSAKSGTIGRVLVDEQAVVVMSSKKTLATGTNSKSVVVVKGRGRKTRKFAFDSRVTATDWIQTAKEYQTAYKTRVSKLDETELEMHKSYLAAYQETCQWSDGEGDDGSHTVAPARKKAALARKSVMQPGVKSELQTITMGGKDWAVYESDGTPYYVDTETGASVWNLEGVETLEEMFSAVDLDKDGTLTIPELESALHNLGFNDAFQAELKGIIDKLKVEKSKGLDWKSFIEEQVQKDFAMYSVEEGANPQVTISQENLKQMFQMIDQDGNGKLSANELRVALKTEEFEPETKKELISMYRAIKGKVNGVTWKQFYERLMKRSFGYDKQAGSDEAGYGQTQADTHANAKKITMGGKEWAVYEHEGTAYYIDIVSGASVWSLEGIDSLEEMFHVIDVDHDGTLTIAELQNALRHNTFNEAFSKELENIIDGLRNSGKNGIDWKNFIEEQVQKDFSQFSRSSGLVAATNTYELQETFRKVDGDGNGELTAHEIRVALKTQKFEPHIKEELKSMYKAIKGKVGAINWRQFQERILKRSEGLQIVDPHADAKKFTMGGRTWAQYESDGVPYYIDVESGASVWKLDGVESLEEMFNAIDVNKDGQLSIRELQLALKEMSFSEEFKFELREIVKKLRRERKKELDWKAFIEEQVQKDFAVYSQEEGAGGAGVDTDEIGQIFNQIDKDGNQELTAHELRVSLKTETFEPHIKKELISMYKAIKGKMNAITWDQFYTRLAARNASEEGRGGAKVQPQGDAHANAKKITMGGKEWAIYEDNGTPYYVDVLSGQSVWNLEGIETLEEMFRAIDVDHDGTLTMQELQLGLNSYSFNDAFKFELADIIKKMQQEGVDGIDWQSFIEDQVQKDFANYGTMEGTAMDVDKVHILVTVFRACDVNGDGDLTANELRAALRSDKFEDDINQEIRRILKAIKGKTNEISWREFVVQGYGHDAAGSITPNDLEAMIQIFKGIDVDGDGVLTVDEISLALNSDKFDPHVVNEIEEMIILAETQGRDHLTWSDFVNRALQGGKPKEGSQKTRRWGKKEIDSSETQTLIEIFKTIDVDGDGTLNLAELRAVMHSHGFDASVKAKIREMIELIKTGATETISWKEFLDKEGVKTEDQIINATPDEVSALLGMFKAIDVDGDGALTIQELNNALTSGKFGEYVNMELEAMILVAKNLGKDTMTWNEFMYHALNPDSAERQELAAENVLEDSQISGNYEEMQQQKLIDEHLAQQQLMIEQMNSQIMQQPYMTGGVQPVAEPEPEYASFATSSMQPRQSMQPALVPLHQSMGIGGVGPPVQGNPYYQNPYPQQQQMQVVQQAPATGVDKAEFDKMKTKWQNKLINMRTEKDNLEEELAELKGTMAKLLQEHEETIDDLEIREAEVEKVQKQMRGDSHTPRFANNIIELHDLADMIKTGELVLGDGPRKGREEAALTILNTASVNIQRSFLHAQERLSGAHFVSDEVVGGDEEERREEEDVFVEEPMVVQGLTQVPEHQGSPKGVFRHREVEPEVGVGEPNMQQRNPRRTIRMQQSDEIVFQQEEEKGVRVHRGEHGMNVELGRDDDEDFLDDVLERYQQQKRLTFSPDVGGGGMGG